MLKLITNKEPLFCLLCLGFAALGSVASQSLLDAATIFLSGSLIWSLFKNRNEWPIYFKKVGPEWAILAYFVTVVAGYVLSASADAEVAWNLKKFTWVLSFYVYIYAFGRSKLKPKQMLWYFSLFFLIPNLYAIVGYLVQFDYITQVVIRRAIGLVNSSTYHAHANALLFVFFAALLIFYFNRLSRTLKVVGTLSLIIFFFSIFLTFTRGIWISLFLSTLIMTYFVNWKWATAFVVGAVILCAGMYITIPQFRDRLNPANSRESTDERANLINVNLQMWHEHPLLGIGYGENQRRLREYWDQPAWNMPQNYIISHAHNQYLNVLSTTGVFGLAFYLVFHFFFLRKNLVMLKAEKNKKGLRYILIFACLWAQFEFIFACVTDVTFEYAKIRALYLMIWALLIAIDRYSDRILVEDL